MGDPLRYVEFVVFIIFGAVLEQPVNKLTNLDNWTLLGQISQSIERLFSLERVNQDIYEQVNDLELSEILLRHLVWNAFACKGVLTVSLGHEEHHFSE